MTYALLLLISLTVTFAQVVMKFAAEAWKVSGTTFSSNVAALILLSFTASCAGQLLWFYVLQSAPLSTSYFFLALVFVLVPLAGWWLFSETLRPLHLVAMGLILLGIVLLGFVEPRG